MRNILQRLRRVQRLGRKIQVHQIGLDSDPGAIWDFLAASHRRVIGGVELRVPNCDAVLLQAISFRDPTTRDVVTDGPARQARAGWRLPLARDLGDRLKAQRDPRTVAHPASEARDVEIRRWTGAAMPTRR
jgi:hypothetical protein